MAIRVASSSQATTFAGLYLSGFLLEDRNRIPIGVHGDGTTLLINTLKKEMLVSHVVAPEWWIPEKQICVIAHDLEIFFFLQFSHPRRIVSSPSFSHSQTRLLVLPHAPLQQKRRLQHNAVPRCVQSGTGLSKENQSGPKPHKVGSFVP